MVSGIVCRHCCLGVVDLIQMPNVWKAKSQAAPPFSLPFHFVIISIWVTKPSSCFLYKITVFLGIFAYVKLKLSKDANYNHTFSFLRFIQKEWNKLVCNYVYRQELILSGDGKYFCRYWRIWSSWYCNHF